MMKVLRYLHRDRYNFIDFWISIAAGVSLAKSDWRTSAFFVGGGVIANVAIGTIIRLWDEAKTPEKIAGDRT